ncbi:NACHT domain-containing protein [Nostoc sp. FACHB-152]|nr:NACHT domain-containing protein [Nostoc sp. FACHB-152]MBD2471180.1 NACHT domain-containing protein [Nostoc sp. FACHB-145]
MRLYSLLGDRATALRVYHRCMTLLQEELGVDPSPATRQLYERLLREEAEIPEEHRSRGAGKNETVASPLPLSSLHCDWGEAIDVSVFYGRKAEQKTLREWILRDNCRLIALLGMGGIGKTALAVKVAQELIEAEETAFELVIWRSLRNAPPFETLLNDWVLFLSHQQETRIDLQQLLFYLRSHRCLLILDNVETIFQAGNRAGQYRSGYERYGELFTVIGETAHQSCLLFTSREKTPEVATLESLEAKVRSLQLTGSSEVAQTLIQAARLIGSDEQKQILAKSYSHNPLAIKIVASSIRDIFGGDVQEFLSQDALLFNGARQLLDQQFERLSNLEQTILYWLAINREWTTIAELAADIVPSVPRTRLLEALESLVWRSLIERRGSSYTQQPVVMEYVCDRLTTQIVNELVTTELSLFVSHALIKTTTSDYIRESQVQLILQPIADQFRHNCNSQSSLTQQISQILTALRSLDSEIGYGCGNLINLCLHLKFDLTGYNFSHLSIRHVYFLGFNLHQVNFSNANFRECAFHQTFSVVFSVAFSPDNQILAIGDMNSHVRLWQLANGQPLLTLQEHTSRVHSVAWHPDGQILATGSDDQTIKLWNTQTGECLQTLRGHLGSVWSVAWSPDGKILASSSADQTIKRWNPKSGECLQTLEGHQNLIWFVAWSPDGKILASGSDDQTIRLWDIPSGECIQTLQAEGNWVRSLVWHPHEKILASASTDKLLRLWDVNTGQCLRVIKGHTRWIYSVAWSLDGQLLATSSTDRTVKLWNVQTGECLKSLVGHNSLVWSTAWSPNGRILASSSDDCTIKLWNSVTGECLKTLRGHHSLIWYVSWSPDGKMLASGSNDQTVRLWDINTGECLRILRSDRPYEGMNITDVTGLTDAQKASLKALGAITNQ